MNILRKLLGMRWAITRKSTWLQINLVYFPLGLIIGLLFFLVLAAFSATWQLRSLIFSLTFGVCISLGITNCLLFALKRFLNWKNTSWRTFILYFLVCFTGMILGVELAYLILSFSFSLSPIFPHWIDYLFNLPFVFAICALVYAYNYRIAQEQYKLKEKEIDLLKLRQQHIQVELDALQAKINPHFLYNALNSITTLIREDPDLAEEMTIKLSKLFRYSINHAKQNLIPVTEELDILNTYLDIERIRFGDRIQFNVAADHAVLNDKIPRFLLQPLVENALKHGLKNREKGGLLEVNVRSGEQGNIELSVHDNGTPFPEQPHAGYGLQSTYDKLELLYTGKAQMQLINFPKKQVLLTLPNTI